MSIINNKELKNHIDKYLEEQLIHSDKAFLQDKILLWDNIKLMNDRIKILETQIKRLKSFDSIKIEDRITILEVQIKRLTGVNNG